MILRNATIKYKGYDPDLIKPKSAKRICVSCENSECKNPIRYVMKYAYHPSCGSCARSGKNNPMYGKPGTNLGKKFSNEHKKNISDGNKGKVRSEETKKNHSEFMTGRTGESAMNWQGGISYEPYCPKFNKQLKQLVRNRYNNCDYISGIHKDVCNKTKTGKIRELTIHHIDYDKGQGCNGKKFNLIPVSSRHNSIFNSNRFFWNKLFIYSLEIDEWYYEDKEINIKEMI